MTTAIDTMEAGTELDRNVADAVGIELLNPGDHVLHHNRWSNGDLVEWKPSTDWNDAMFAAEQFGLLDTNSYALDLWNDSQIEYSWILTKGMDVQASAPTGPLAICLAILKLANRDT